jgi:sulfatase modifying factor 1
MRLSKVGLLASCLIVLALIMFLSGCAEQKEWKKAQQTNTVESYRAFLKQFPNGKTSDKAKLAIENIEWENANQSKMLGDYLIFMKKYPKSQYLAQAKAEADKLMVAMGKNGSLMVLIPEGEFEMGSQLQEDEMPVHKVSVKAFYMDVYEVTNVQYKKFVDATNYKKPNCWKDPTLGGSEQPIVTITWFDAQEYAKWAGKRLPTEAEWEKAARGGLVGKLYPWGDKLFHDNANYYGSGGKDFWVTSANVGAFDPNGYGLFDMAGNVQEWCADFYDAKYYATSPNQNPTGPKSGTSMVARSGSWGDEIQNNKESGLRVAKRRYIDPYGFDSYTGFRCAMDK